MDNIFIINELRTKRRNQNRKQNQQKNHFKTKESIPKTVKSYI